ncbi:hypothetical protein KR009_011514 [Drosophila setifemur]|nr:hypothetical protein KR009_011514 [Drosophila setifemur]
MNEYDVRWAKLADLKDINLLIRSPGVKWFGNIRPKFHGEDSLFCSYQTHRMLALSKVTSKLVAYAEFRNYPPVSALPSDCWLEWLNCRYCLSMSITWLNALFFNFCIYKSENTAVIPEIVEELFYRESRVWFLITIRTPNVQQPSHFAETFTELEHISKIFYPREYSSETNPNTQSLYIVHRTELLPKITFRKALAEDNDDVIAIQEPEMPELRQELGEFYIAEEVMGQDLGDGKSLLVVAETTNRSQETKMALFLWMTSDIDIRFYVRNYHLTSFGNLVKVDPSQLFHFETMTVCSVRRRGAASMFTTTAMEDLIAQTILGGFQRNDSDMSVASAGKFRLRSINGVIVDTNGPDENNFYMRESVYSKFKYIVEKLRSVEYYFRFEEEIVNFMYSSNSLPDGERAIQAASNVFLLKCLVASQDFALPRLFNAMVAMFCAYPDRDYCLLVISKRRKPIRSHIEVLQYFIVGWLPKKHVHKIINYIQFQSMQPVVSRPSGEDNQEDVYITHRSTIFGEISLYKLEKEDVDEVRALMLGNLAAEPAGSEVSSVTYCSKVNEREELENEIQTLNGIMKDVLENEFSEFAVFTIRCGNSSRPARENTSVGFVVLRQFHNLNKLYDHYNLSKHEFSLDRLRAEIISLRLHPLFMVSSDLIFRDLARKTNYYDFYFISPLADQKFTNDLKKKMMVVEPKPVKKAPIFFQVHQKTKQSSISVNLNTPNYSRDHLIVYRHKLKPIKWFTNSTKLVIIGFTSVAKAFLRRLIFQWNNDNKKNLENFTCLGWVQVTVICRPGVVEAEYDNMFQCPYCANTRKCYISYKNSSCFVRDCCARMDLRFWVHFVAGTEMAINREKKCVTLDSCEIPYDTLLLMCGRRFVLRQPENCEQREPVNFLEINSRLSKILLYYKVRALLEDMPRTYSILIYGGNLFTYECIAFLINHGVDCSRMVLVLPHRFTGHEAVDKQKNPFWDKNIQLILDQILADSGLTIFEDYNFQHWVVHESSDFIMGVVFQHFPSRTTMTFECDLFIAFSEGHLYYKHKQMLQDANIELDGDDIVVNDCYRTNDPNIYAAGSFVQIKPEPNYQYQCTSEREIAAKVRDPSFDFLTRSFREYLFPRKLLHHLGIAPQKDFEDRYAEPLHFQGMLPLNYFITKVIMPRRYLTTQLLSQLSCNLTTYKGNTFCRVGLSSHMVVEEIVVVTKQKAHLDFLQHFCGKHELLLNNLRARYKAKTIASLFSFFQEPWTELIMHDKFGDLQAVNRELLRPMALSTLSRVHVSAFQTVTDQDFITLNKCYLEHNLLNFLREHRRDFRHRFALPEDFQMSDLTNWQHYAKAPTEGETEPSTDC